jgi:hypothetical protein
LQKIIKVRRLSQQLGCTVPMLGPMTEQQALDTISYLERLVEHNETLPLGVDTVYPCPCCKGVVPHCGCQITGDGQWWAAQGTGDWWCCETHHNNNYEGA